MKQIVYITWFDYLIIIKYWEVETYYKLDYFSIQPPIPLWTLTTEVITTDI